MRLLILGESCLIKLSSFDKSIFTTLSIIASIYARQIAAVTPKKHTAVVIEKIEDINYNEECDCVNIHFKTGTAIKAYKVADEYRKAGKTVILSGTHPTALLEEALTHADSVFVGSAEQLWPIAIEDLEKGKLKKIYDTKNYNKQKTTITENFEIPSNLTLIGIIEATRGCPYKCDFCQESNVQSGSIFQVRPIEEIIKEIKKIPQKFLFFCDASLTIDVEYTKELFSKMKPLNKKFICEGNSDVLAKDEELLKLASEAGCIEWTVGFESFSQQTLADINKKTNTIEEFKQVVKNIHKYKMAILGNFIFGFDQDTPNIFQLASENIKKLGLDSARFAILTPYPGTPLFEKLEKEGRIMTYDWSKYNRKNVVFKPKNMTVEELQTGFYRIADDFNSVPNLIYRDIRSLKYGIYPFMSTVGRNIESYMNRPRKWILKK
jgi:radical SAM superfamily enzyme YgiQ (UPF0313 family)